MSILFYRFGSFLLDPRERQLTCDGRPVPLRAKLLDTLIFLVQHAGQLARRDELMKVVWPDTVVEGGNLDHNLSVLRKILHQNESTQKFIETVPREGYRFVAEVRTIEDKPVVFLAETFPPVFMAEREPEIQQLQLALKEAQSGRRQIVFLTGEAGIGKTTLVRKFLSGLHHIGPAWIGLGECLDQRGQGEAYMPLLEALGKICGQSGGQTAVEILQRRAPTWLSQIPLATTLNERLLLQQSLIGPTQERMLREGADALQAMATDNLLIIVLEDLHWSDGSTLDLLQHVACTDPAHLLIIGTYRPAEMKWRARSVVHLARQLRLREACREIPLRLLSEQGIANYLHERLGGPVPPELSHLLLLRTEGNPLFVTSLVNSWVTSGFLHEDKEGWTLSYDLTANALESPDKLSRVIEEQLQELPLAEQEIVGAASLIGMEFCAAAVAAALGCSTVDTESQCAAMALRGQFFAARSRSDWPDGTVCQSYGFLHSLYREVGYRRVPAGRRVHWHHQIGLRLEVGFALDLDRIAGELADHFQQGNDAYRGIPYRVKAARQSLKRDAVPEAIFHLTNALQMLHRIPEPQERARFELEVDDLLSLAMGASRGLSDLETDTAFQRMYEHTRSLGQQVGKFPIIFGFAVLLESRGQHQRAQEVMEKYVPRQELDGRYKVERLNLLACARFHEGAFVDTLALAERGVKAYSPKEHSGIFSHRAKNPGIACHLWVALSLWFLGYPGQALRRARQGVSLSEEGAHPYALASVWVQRAFLHVLRRERKAARLWAERSVRLAREHGLHYGEAAGKVLHGWAQAQLGQLEPGIAELREGIAGCAATGVELDRSFHLALLAESYILARDRSAATATLKEALDEAGRTRSHFYEGELWRLQGDLQLTFASDYNGASEHFLRAIGIAQSQQARSLELRAAVSLARLSRAQGKCDNSNSLLAEVYRSFTGPQDTPDLRDARLELDQLQADMDEENQSEFQMDHQFRQASA